MLEEVWPGVGELRLSSMELLKLTPSISSPPEEKQRIKRIIYVYNSVYRMYNVHVAIAGSDVKAGITGAYVTTLNNLNA